MKIVNYLVMLLIVSSITSCSYKSIKPSVNQENLDFTCDGLISAVKANWKQHKELKYFKYDEEFLTILQRDYQNCFKTLKKVDIINLLGEPTENIENDYVFYSLNEGCMGKLPQDCKVLYFQFRESDGTVIVYLVQEHSVHIHYKQN